MKAFLDSIIRNTEGDYQFVFLCFLVGVATVVLVLSLFAAIDYMEGLLKRILIHQQKRLANKDKDENRWVR